MSTAGKQNEAARRRASKSPQKRAVSHASRGEPLRALTRPVWMPGGRQDLVHISSLVREARFRPDRVRWDGRALVIPLLRRRWELRRAGDEAAIVRSELRLSPVKSWRVELMDSPAPVEGTAGAIELSICSLRGSVGGFVAQDSLDEEIVMDCTQARVKVRVDDVCRVRLADRLAGRRGRGR